MAASLGASLLAPALAQAPARFAPERDYGPFVFESPDGQIAGLSIDILRLVQRHAGIELTMLPARPLSEQLAAARRGEVDLISSLRPTAERAEYLRFSAPYVSVPAVLVARAAAGAAVGLADLTGQPVALGAGYAVEAPMRAAHPEVAWQAVTDDVAALRGVAEGRYRAAVVDVASFHFVTRQHRLAGLQPLSQVGFEYRLSFAAPHRRADLIERIDRSLARLPVAERQEVLNRWMPSGTAPAPARAPMTTRVGLALLALALAMAGVAWWRRRQARPS